MNSNTLNKSLFAGDLGAGLSVVCVGHGVIINKIN